VDDLNLVKLYENLLNLTSLYRGMAARESEHPRAVNTELYLGLAEAYGTSASLLRAEFERAGVDITREPPPSENKEEPHETQSVR